jgi:coproporphyrinogen III oxidase
MHVHTLTASVTDMNSYTHTLCTLQAWADEYFYIPMRGEHRGVGGVFFDDLESIGGTSPGQFVRDIALAFMPSYLPIATARGSQVRHTTAN